VEGEVGRRLVASLAVLLHAAVEQANELRRQRRRLGRQLRLVAEDRGQTLERRLATEGAPPRQHLEEHRPQREQIAPGIGLLAGRLFGRHVADRAEHCARLRMEAERRRIRSRDSEAHPGKQLGEPEIEDLDPPVAGDEEVRGLQVAVNDPRSVGGRETERHLACDPHGFPPTERLLVEARVERTAVEQLRDEERYAIALAEIVQHEKIRMVDPSGGSCFAFEALAGVGVGKRRRRQHLDGDVALDARIVRPVNLAHTSSPDRRDDLVGAETETRRQARSRARRIHRSSFRL
jgi:hypothetical protein